MNERLLSSGIDRLLRVNTKLDVEFNANMFHNETDVRGTVVLAVEPQVVVVAQTSPPIFKSMAAREVEASFIRRHPASSECVRLAWESRIVGVSNNYIPKDAKDDQLPVSVVFLALPPDGALKPANVRLHYRLEAYRYDGIAVETNLAVWGARLLNFSAGGAMIDLPGKPLVEPGFQIYVQLTFPLPGGNFNTTVKSKATVVRVNYNRSEEHTSVGLHFREMDKETRRTFDKVIHHYMLAEQRIRREAA